MEFNQDQAFNTIHVLDDTEAHGRVACAVFNGGVIIKKNIIACSLDAQLIQGKDVQISNELAVQHNIYTDGSVLPLTEYSTACLGSESAKWNKINCVDTRTQELTSVNATLKNTTIENMYLVNNVLDISDTSSASVTFCAHLDSAEIGRAHV